MKSTSLILVAVISLLGFTAFATAAPQKPQPKPKKGNTPDMWIGETARETFPVGVTHHTYRSQAMDCEVGYCIYLPPGYAADTEKRYPVIYNLHGANGDEYRVIYNAEVLHEGIEAGRWPEMIMVFPNGGRGTMYQDSVDGQYLAETTFIEELIPHIDSTYRTIAARHGRCIEGFSMGGRGSTFLAMSHPDMFCSLFNQAGNVYPASEMGTPEFVDKWPQTYLGTDPDKLAANDSFLLLEKNLDQIKGKMRIQVACGTQDSGHLPTVRDYHNALLRHGVDHTYLEIEGLAHNQKEMIATYKDVWFNYHVESLRRAAEAASE